MPAPPKDQYWAAFFNMGVDDLEEGFDLQAGNQREAHEETLCREDDFPAASTPRRVTNTSQSLLSPIIGRREEQNIQILPRVANVPPWISKPKDPKFKEGDLNSYKYVDDGINISPVNMRRAGLLIEEGHFFKEIVDIRTEGILKHIAKNASKKGMRINAEKTSLMCVSAATSFKARVRVELDGQVVNGKDSLRILGVTIDRDCSFRSHVENLRKKLRARTWALSKLRKKGLSEDKLVKAYTSLIWPVAEYAAPVWDAMLTAEQSEKLERQQTQALKNIFGPGLSARKMRMKADLDTLMKRREKMSLSEVC